MDCGKGWVVLVVAGKGIVYLAELARGERKGFTGGCDREKDWVCVRDILE